VAGDAREWKRVAGVVPTCVVSFDYVFNSDENKAVLRGIYEELTADENVLWLLVNMEQEAREVLEFGDVHTATDSDNDFLADGAGAAAQERREAARRAYTASWVHVSDSPLLLLASHSSLRPPTAACGLPQQPAASHSSLRPPTAACGLPQVSTNAHSML
jgi:hypothetical protein